MIWISFDNTPFYHYIPVVAATLEYSIQHGFTSHGNWKCWTRICRIMIWLLYIKFAIQNLLNGLRRRSTIYDIEVYYEVWIMVKTSLYNFPLSFDLFVYIMLYYLNLIWDWYRNKLTYLQIHVEDILRYNAVLHTFVSLCNYAMS